MNKHIQMVADAYAFGYGKSTESASASRTGYIAGAMYMEGEIVKDIASLRDNYMRQLSEVFTEDDLKRYQFKR